MAIWIRLSSCDGRSYQMPAGAISIISVEYPDGNDPPKYLYQRELTHPDFWGQDGFYAFAPATTDTSIRAVIFPVYSSGVAEI
ncbi:MAG: hypothetical protein WBD56_16585 [Anaerolineales bacterium]